MAASEREWMPDGVAAAYVGGLVGIPLFAGLFSYLTGVHVVLIGAVLFLPWLFLVAPRALSTPEAGDRSMRVLGGLAAVPVVAVGIDYATPVPFASAVVPLFLVWALMLVPRDQAKADTGLPVPREGIRPVRFRWVAGWTVLAVVTVPLLLALFFL